MTYRKETGDTIVQSPYILNIIVSDFSEPCRCLPESRLMPRSSSKMTATHRAKWKFHARETRVSKGTTGLL